MAIYGQYTYCIKFRSWSVILACFWATSLAVYLVVNAVSYTIPYNDDINALLESVKRVKMAGDLFPRPNVKERMWQYRGTKRRPLNSPSDSLSSAPGGPSAIFDKCAPPP